MSPHVLRLRGTFWVTAAAAALALPFAVLLSGARPAPSGFLWDLSMGMGFAALALAALQFAVTGRFRWLTHPFGADIVYVFHRYFSWGVAALMLGHFAILYIWFRPALGELNPLTARWELTSGRVALGCFVLLIVSSEFRKRLRLDYHWWRLAHVVLAVFGFAAAVAHVLGVGNYTALPDKRGLWLAVTVGFAGLLIWTRGIRPAIQLANPWRVVANRAERGGVRTLVLRPEGRPLSAWRPGQFAWLNIGDSPFSLNEHPFTISTAPDRGPDISFSIKPLGDDTARLMHTPPGTVAYVDGPYGIFSVDHFPEAPGFVMIAGGVGITPILSNLHALQDRGDPRPVILIYANSDWDGAAFREELAAMRDDIDLTVVHVPETAPEGWTGESGRVDADLLRRHLPEATRGWPHLLCGPPGLTRAVTQALRDMGVPAGRIETEIFDMV
ncbi:MAG: ferric reductase-like transmembrane domain-containing protein [Gemmobacter sp.]